LALFDALQFDVAPCDRRPAGVFAQRLYLNPYIASALQSFAEPGASYQAWPVSPLLPQHSNNELLTENFLHIDKE
jgi:hypothetical protein